MANLQSPLDGQPEYGAFLKWLLKDGYYLCYFAAAAITLYFASFHGSGWCLIPAAIIVIIGGILHSGHINFYKWVPTGQVYSVDTCGGGHNPLCHHVMIAGPTASGGRGTRHISLDVSTWELYEVNDLYPLPDAEIQRRRDVRRQLPGGRSR